MLKISNASMFAAFNGVVALLGTIVGVLTVDRIGRRFIVVHSSIVLTLVCILMIFLNAASIGGVIPYMGMVFLFVYNMGISLAIYPYTTEITTAIAVGLGLSLQYLLKATLVKLVPILMVTI
jgi:Sugar (and other) transporter